MLYNKPMRRGEGGGAREREREWGGEENKIMHHIHTLTSPYLNRTETESDLPKHFNNLNSQQVTSDLYSPSRPDKKLTCQVSPRNTKWRLYPGVSSSC